MTSQLRLVPAAEGRELLGGRMVLKVSGAETDDAYTLCIGLTPPGLGPPLHVHEQDDQTHYVTRGTYELVCGPDVVIAGPGACVHMPRYTPHTFRNVGDEPAELIEFTAPGGIDRYFDAVAHLGPSAMDLEARNDVGRPFGISFPEHPEAYIEPSPGETRRAATVVAAGEGRRVDLGGHEAICRMEAADTGGSHSLTEVALPAGAVASLGASGAMVLVTLEGAVTVRQNGERVDAAQGDSVAMLSVGEAAVETGDWPARLIAYAIEAGN